MNMSSEKETTNVRSVCDQCDLTISDLSRISGVSRTTIYALDRGEPVRRATVVRLLRALGQSKRCNPVWEQIRAELRRMGAGTGRARTAREVIDALDEIVLDVATIGDAQGSYDHSRLVQLVRELDRIVKNL